MRMRTIKPGFFENDELCALPMAARLLFAGLWCYADREGRFAWRPKRIQIAVLPYDRDADIESLLGDLKRGGFIAQYGQDGAYGHVLRFRDHQRPSPRESESKLPVPSGLVPSTTKAVPEHNQGNAMDAQSLGSGVLDVGSGMQSLETTTPPPKAAGRRTAPRKRVISSPAQHEVMRWFSEQYRSRLGTPYVAKAADGPQVRKALSTFQADTLKERLSAGLDTSDAFIANSDRSLGFLLSQINRPSLRGLDAVQTNGKPTVRRQAEVIADVVGRLEREDAAHG